MGKLISLMHVSLDGLVAGPKGEMNWIKVNEEIFDHVGERVNKSDTALYGRKTYEMMEDYWPTAGDEPGASKHDIEHSKWYKDVHKIVLSKTMEGKNIANTEIVSDNLVEKINKIKQARNGGSNEILLFGSPTATHSLMQQNLIDGYWIFVNPLILGEGIPLFEGIRSQMELKLLNTKQFANGVIALDYSVEQH